MSTLKTDDWHTWKCPQCTSEDGTLVEEIHTNYVTCYSSVLFYILCNKCKERDTPRECRINYLIKLHT